MNLYENIKLNEEDCGKFADVEFKYFKDKSKEICLAIKQYFQDAGYSVYSKVKYSTSYFYYGPVFTVELDAERGWEVGVIFDERDFSYKGLELSSKLITDTSELKALQKLITSAKKLNKSEILLNALK